MRGILLWVGLLMSPTVCSADTLALYCGPDRVVLGYVHEGQSVEQGIQDVQHSSGYRDYCLTERVQRPDGAWESRPTTPQFHIVRVVTLPASPSGREPVVMADGSVAFQPATDRSGWAEKNRKARMKLKAMGNLTDDDLAALGIR